MVVLYVVCSLHLGSKQASLFILGKLFMCVCVGIIVAHKCKTRNGARTCARTHVCTHQHTDRRTEISMYSNDLTISLPSCDMAKGHIAVSSVLIHLMNQYMLTLVVLVCLHMTFIE